MEQTLSSQVHSGHCVCLWSGEQTRTDLTPGSWGSAVADMTMLFRSGPGGLTLLLKLVAKFGECAKVIQGASSGF